LPIIAFLWNIYWWKQPPLGPILAIGIGNAPNRTKDKPGIFIVEEGVNSSSKQPTFNPIFISSILPSLNNWTKRHYLLTWMVFIYLQNDPLSWTVALIIPKAGFIV
jgi:hypothetical protein